MLFAAPLGCLLCHYHPAAGRSHEPPRARAEHAPRLLPWRAAADESYLPRLSVAGIVDESAAPAMRPARYRESPNSSRRWFRLLAAPRAKWRALARSALRPPAVMS